MVMMFAAQDADTPAGRPMAAPIPVAPVVEYVIVVIGLLIQTDWLSVPAPEVRVMVLLGVSVITA